METKKKKTSKHINDIKCLIYNVTLHENLVRQICMAPVDELKISNQDYATLRAFYKFNYNTQSRMMLAAGKSSFTYVDFEAKNMPGVPAEIRLFTKQGSVQDHILYQVDNTTLDKGLFEIKTP